MATLKEQYAALIEQNAALIEQNRQLGTALHTLAGTLLDREPPAVQTRTADDKGKTLVEFIRNDWLPTKRGLSENTRQKYIALMPHIERAFPAVRLGDVDYTSVNRFVDTLLECMTLATAKQIITNILHPALKLAKKWHLIADDPAEGIEFPKNPAKQRRAATNEELKALERQAKTHRLAFTIPLLYMTGLRRGELLALEWNDIDFATKTIRIDKAYIHNTSHGNALVSPKTKTSYRLIPIHADLLPILKAERAKADREGKHFVVSQAKHDKQVSPTEYGRIFRGWKDGACVGRDISPHTMRHTYATRLADAGIDEISIMRLMGHADTRITVGTYIDKKGDIEALRKASSVLCLANEQKVP